MVAHQEAKEARAKAKAEKIESSATLAIIETEPWTPPADAHPEISLRDFVRGAWRVLEPAVPFVDSWHIGLYCEHAEAISTGQLEETGVLVNTPPGTSKSLFWSVFWPAWEWTWAPWTRWLTSSYDDSLALRDADKTRTLMQSEWYQLRISEPWSFTGTQNAKSYYLNDRTGWRIATSMSGGNTGWHAHRVLVDDPHNVKKAESDLIRQGTVDAWREVYPSRADLPGAVRVVIGQRTHEEDLSADWLERERAHIHHIELRMEYEKPAQSPAPASQSGALHTSGAAMECSLTHAPHDSRSTEGEILIAERMSAARLERLKIDLGPYAYSAQYQQAPTPRAGMVLDPAWFPQTPSLERATVDLVAAFDLNYSDVETSDWTVGLLAAVERTPVLPRIHLITAFREHLSEDKHVEHIGEWLSLWKPIMVGIEKRAYEKQGAARDLCRQLLAYCEERQWTLDIEPIEVDTDKVSRAMIIPGRAKAGLITADKRAPFWGILSRQMSQFPRSAHDDDVDALAHLVRLVVEKLERIRSVGSLLGQSAPIVIGEATNGHRSDWADAAAAGLR